MSHPVWVRGLKPLMECLWRYSHLVAPRVGAWIETSILLNALMNATSHPVWVRGLKPALKTKAI